MHLPTASLIQSHHYTLLLENPNVVFSSLLCPGFSDQLFFLCRFTINILDKSLISRMHITFKTYPIPDKTNETRKGVQSVNPYPANVENMVSF